MVHAVQCDDGLTAGAMATIGRNVCLVLGHGKTHLMQSLIRYCTVFAVRFSRLFSSPSLVVSLFVFKAYVLEREKGFEPSTPTLATWCSTPELLPHVPTQPGDTSGHRRNPPRARPPPDQIQYSATTRDCKPSSENAAPQPDRPRLAPASFHLLNDSPDDSLRKIDHVAGDSAKSGASDRDQSTMNYVLQVVKGRSATTTLKLADAVTSIGRHDDCQIRIKSSQVSRRHCEVFEAGGKLAIRDLGSSNGTFVNGKKITGQQVLKSGDELTVGTVTLRVAKLGQGVPAAQQPSSDSTPKPKASDTAVVDAISAGDDDDFEVELSEDQPPSDMEIIPLAEDEPVQPAGNPVSTKSRKTSKTTASTPTEEKTTVKSTDQPEKEDDAVAQFLLDLKLDDEE
jgi:pSer/pThr/pTyr-binding forkhead associated (FHA) protein